MKMEFTSLRSTSTRFRIISKDALLCNESSKENECCIEHIETRYLFVRDLVENDRIKLDSFNNYGTRWASST